jgi:hypothetical protein
MATTDEIADKIAADNSLTKVQAKSIWPIAADTA